MTGISTWIFLQVLLMVLFGRIKNTSSADLSNHWIFPFLGFLYPTNNPFCDFFFVLQNEKKWRNGTGFQCRFLGDFVW